MKWFSLVFVLATVPAMGLLPPQRSAVRSPQGAVQGAGPSYRYLPVDFDGDGLVDALAIESSGAARLLVQQADGSFLDLTEALGLGGVGAVEGAFWRDLTNDQRPDLLVARPGGGLGLFVWDGRAFTDQTVALEGTATGEVKAVTFEDYDANGWSDLALWAPDGSVRVVLNHGELAFTEGELGSVRGELLLQPSAPSGRQALTSGLPTAPAGGITPLGGGCATQIINQANSTCINASSTPALGSLYPLSSNLFVDNPTGFVGINTTTPSQRLDVAGIVKVAGIQFPDGTQTTMTQVGPPGEPGPEGPEGQPGTVLPAGTILMWAGALTPDGFLLCNGATFDENLYPELAAAIGMQYGGGTSFKVPDLIQRFPLGKADSGTGVMLGEKGGSIDHDHDMSHTHGTPSHTHSLPDHDHTVPSHFHGKGTISIGNSGAHSHTLQRWVAPNSGSGAAFIDDSAYIEQGMGPYFPGSLSVINPSVHSHGNGDFSGSVGNTAGQSGDSNFSTTSTESVSITGGAGTTNSISTSLTGSGNPPYLAVNFIIKT